MYYGPILLGKAGFGNEDNVNSTLIAALPLAGMNALGTLIAVFYIDSLGRRFIMLRCLPFIGLSLLAIAYGLGLHGWGNPEN